MGCSLGSMRTSLTATWAGCFSAHTIALESTNPQTDQMRAHVGPVQERSEASPFGGDGDAAAAGEASASGAGGGARRPAPSTNGAVVRAMSPTSAAAFAGSGALRENAAGATVIAHA